jgi:hypothetical protein
LGNRDAVANYPPSFRGAPLGASPESIRTIVVMGSGLDALRRAFGPRYFLDPKENLVGIVFVQGPSIRAAYHAQLRSMVYGAMTSSKGEK